MFLLKRTRCKSAAKLATAKALKASGSFLFEFGADHDSQQLTAISNAAEGSFIFVETSDTVIDAFGGAIGGQMPGLMYNIVSMSPRIVAT